MAHRRAAQGAPSCGRAELDFRDLGSLRGSEGQQQNCNGMGSCSEAATRRRERSRRGEEGGGHRLWQETKQTVEVSDYSHSSPVRPPLGSHTRTQLQAPLAQGAANSGQKSGPQTGAQTGT